MDKQIVASITKALRELDLLHSHRMETVDGTAIFATQIRSPESLKVLCEFVFHRNTDSLHVQIRWERANATSRKHLLEFVNPSNESVGSCEFGLGAEIDGRARTFHLIEGLAVDERVSVEKLYSTGSGRAYRILRVPELVSTIERYLHALSIMLGVR